MFHLQPVGGTRSRSPGVVGNFELLKSLERINMLILGPEIRQKSRLGVSVISITIGFY